MKLLCYLDCVVRKLAKLSFNFFYNRHLKNLIKKCNKITHKEEL